MSKRWSVLLVCVVLTIGGVVGVCLTGTSPPRSAPEFAAARAHASQQIPAAAFTPIAAALGTDDPAYRVRDLVAVNRAQGLRVSFERSGALVRSGAGRLRLSLVGYGRAGALEKVGPSTPVASGNRVSYARALVREWYANGPMGLEQGFDLTRAPRIAAGRGGADPTLTLALRPAGNLVARLSRDEVTFSGSGVQLRYGGLSVSDASGRVLPASFGLSAGRVLIRVDARGAHFPVRVDPFIQQARLSAADGLPSDGFGTAVAISGNTIVAGAPNHEVGSHAGQGAVYVFVEPAGGWATTTSPTAELTVASGSAGDALGSSVAIDGDTIVAGAPQVKVGTSAGEGTAYVFAMHDGSWASTGAPDAALSAADTDGHAADELGSAVAVAGDTVFAGAPHSYADGSAIYVYAKPDGGWTSTATPTTEIAPDSCDHCDNTPQTVGGSLAASGDTVVTGAPTSTLTTDTTTTASGLVAVYVEPSGGWQNESSNPASVQPTATLYGSDPADGDALGTSVAISANTVVAGAPGHGPAGAAYLWILPASPVNTGYTQTAELSDAGASRGDALGTSVGVSGDAVGVGAPQSGSDAGYADVFDMPAGGWADETTPTQRLAVSGQSSIDTFAQAVALAGGTLVGSALPHVNGGDAGSAYVFAASPPTIAITTPADGQTYTQGQSLTAAYSCTDTSGSGLAACSGLVPDGTSIDTSTTGTKTFTVTATDDDGNTSTQSVSYTIAPASQEIGVFTQPTSTASTPQPGAAPQPDFTAGANPALSGAPVAFTVKNPDPTATYTWTFCDAPTFAPAAHGGGQVASYPGTFSDPCQNPNDPTATGASVTQEFPLAPGHQTADYTATAGDGIRAVYPVLLTATNAAGTTTQRQQIAVIDAVPPTPGFRSAALTSHTLQVPLSGEIDLQSTASDPNIAAGSGVVEQDWDFSDGLGHSQDVVCVGTGTCIQNAPTPLHYCGAGPGKASYDNPGGFPAGCGPVIGHSAPVFSPLGPIALPCGLFGKPACPTKPSGGTLLNNGTPTAGEPGTAECGKGVSAKQCTLAEPKLRRRGHATERPRSLAANAPAYTQQPGLEGTLVGTRPCGVTALNRSGAQAAPALTVSQPCPGLSYNLVQADFQRAGLEPLSAIDAEVPTATFGTDTQMDAEAHFLDEYSADVQFFSGLVPVNQAQDHGFFQNPDPAPDYVTQSVENSSGLVSQQTVPLQIAPHDYPSADWRLVAPSGINAGTDTVGVPSSGATSCAGVTSPCIDLSDVAPAAGTKLDWYVLQVGTTPENPVACPNNQTYHIKEVPPADLLNGSQSVNLGCWADGAPVINDPVTTMVTQHPADLHFSFPEASENVTYSMMLTVYDQYGLAARSRIDGIVVKQTAGTCKSVGASQPMGLGQQPLGGAGGFQGDCVDISTAPGGPSAGEGNIYETSSVLTVNGLSMQPDPHYDLILDNTSDADPQLFAIPASQYPGTDKMTTAWVAKEEQAQTSQPTGHVQILAGPKHDLVGDSSSFSPQDGATILGQPGGLSSLTVPDATHGSYNAVPVAAGGAVTITPLPAASTQEMFNLMLPEGIGSTTTNDTSSVTINHSTVPVVQTQSTEPFAGVALRHRGWRSRRWTRHPFRYAKSALRALKDIEAHDPGSTEADPPVVVAQDSTLGGDQGAALTNAPTQSAGTSDSSDNTNPLCSIPDRAFGSGDPSAPINFAYDPTTGDYYANVMLDFGFLPGDPAADGCLVFHGTRLISAYGHFAAAIPLGPVTLQSFTVTYADGSSTTDGTGAGVPEFSANVMFSVTGLSPVNGQVTFTYKPDNDDVRLDGSVNVGPLTVGQAYLELMKATSGPLDGSEVAAFGGALGVDFGPASIEAQLAGVVGGGAFYVEGGGQGCLGSLCVDVDGEVDSDGVAACGSILGASVGVSYHDNDSPKLGVFFSGCDLSGYIPANLAPYFQGAPLLTASRSSSDTAAPATTAKPASCPTTSLTTGQDSTATGPTAVEVPIGQSPSLPAGTPAGGQAIPSGGYGICVPSGLNGAVIQVLGDGAAPNVTFTEPSGQKRSFSPSTLGDTFSFASGNRIGNPSATPTGVVQQDPLTDTTTLIVNDPAGGRWQISPTAGQSTVNILSIGQADTLPPIANEPFSMSAIGKASPTSIRHLVSSDIVIAAKTRLADLVGPLRLREANRVRVLRLRLKSGDGTVAIVDSLAAGGGEVLGKISGTGLHTISFDPPAGSGRNTLVAYFLDHTGLIRETRIIGTLMAPAPAKIPPMKVVKVIRQADRAIVLLDQGSLNSSPRTAAAVVQITTSTGGRDTLQLSGRDIIYFDGHPAFIVPDIPGSEGLALGIEDVASSATGPLVHVRDSGTVHLLKRRI